MNWLIGMAIVSVFSVCIILLRLFFSQIISILVSILALYFICYYMPMMIGKSFIESLPK
jgi:hypothetical protein